MSFAKNLVKLRKTKNMSQEDLAERLEISRQAVTRWESGDGYPEMDRLKAIAELFDVSLDTLVYKNIELRDPKHHSALAHFSAFYNSFAHGIAIGVGIIILGLASLVALSVPEPDDPRNIFALLTFFAACLIAVPIFINFGLSYKNLKAKTPPENRTLTPDEAEKVTRSFPLHISISVVAIIFSIAFMIALYGLHIFPELSTIPAAIMLTVWAVAVPFLVNAGIKYSATKSKPADFVRSATDEKRELLIGKICGVIMLSATAVYLATGFIADLWGTTWFVFPLGGLLCAIIGTIFGAPENHCP
jgi:transcriptional regulator with XRE-family HTH domain